MERKKIIDAVCLLLYKNKGSAGVSRQGFYDLCEEKFRVAIDKFLDDGEDVLVEHDRLVEMWSISECMDVEEINLVNKALNRETFWNIYHMYSEEDISKIKDKKISSECHLQYMQLKEVRRRKAINFTGKKSVRSYIFNRDGKVCKFCKAEDLLCLDHIVPVSKGGENTYENIQVLCRSCNSKKSNKTNYGK